MRPGQGGAVAYRGELRRLLGPGSVDRRLLLHRVLLFAGIGGGLGVLHLVAPGGTEHVALTALFASLVPVFAPLCFVPVAFDRTEQTTGAGVVIVRVGVASVLGWCVGAVHLIVWLVLAELTGTIGPPAPGDVAFLAVVAVITTVLAGTVLSAPRSDALALPAATGASVVLYAAAFVVHGTMLEPSLASIRAHFSGGPATTEVVGGALALAAVALLLRRELRSANHEGRGARRAAAGSTK